MSFFGKKQRMSDAQLRKELKELRTKNTKAKNRRKLEASLKAERREAFNNSKKGRVLKGLKSAAKEGGLALKKYSEQNKKKYSSSKKKKKDDFGFSW